ncbi:hypothetical protein [Persicobacter diffluens]|uniref:Plasmid transfer protein n=1 Tax=Persicobacter diffluens TaxID=981 RepID=A0AAN5ANH4_9BACT|nr:plasmid transfer protein [Persicobacter diffluens]
MWSFNEIIDLGFLDFIKEIRDIFGYTELADHARYGQYLAGVFTMLFMAVKSYGMIVGDRQWEIMPLLRPFAIGLVIMNWGAFLALIDVPLRGVSRISEDGFRKKVEQTQTEYQLVMQLTNELGMKMINGAMEVNQNSEQQEQGVFEKLGVSLSKMASLIEGARIMVMGLLKFIPKLWMSGLCHWIYQFCFYGVMFIQQIFLVILGLLGPYAFAISILPGFSDSYIQWISRYISVSLYSLIANIIATVSMFGMNYTNRADIETLQQILDDEEHYISWLFQSDFTFTMPALMMLLGGLMMFTIPAISTWIVSTSGLGNALGNSVRGGQALGMLARKAVTGGVA